MSRYYWYYQAPIGYYYNCNLYSLNPEKELQNWDFGSSECNNISTPVVENETVYVTMNDRTTDNVTLYALNPGDKSVKWSFEQSTYSFAPIVDNDTVYALINDRSSDNVT